MEHPVAPRRLLIQLVRHGRLVHLNAPPFACPHMPDLGPAFHGVGWGLPPAGSNLPDARYWGRHTQSPGPM